MSIISILSESTKSSLVFLIVLYEIKLHLMLQGNSYTINVHWWSFKVLIWHINSDIFRDFLWRLISAEGLEWDCNTPLWVQGRVLLGSSDKALGSSKNVMLWNYLILIKIHPAHLVMKPIQYIFSKIFKFQEIQVLNIFYINHMLV